MNRKILTLCCFAMVASQLAWAAPSNKWRLEFSGGADSDGVITLMLTPVGGTSVSYRTEISEGRRENGVAKDVVTSLQAQLPEDAYKVERDDGEDVLIKKRRGAADFDVLIEQNTVKGVRINLDRE